MTAKRKTILVGLDFSDSSRAALAEAMRLRKSCGGKLVVTHVIDERLWHQLADDLHLSHNAVIEKAEAELKREITDPSDAIESHAIVGHPVEALLELCEECEADLLLLGAQGSREERPNPPGLGNVSSRLLRHAPCDVLLVRKTQDHPFRKIIAGVDFSDSSSRVVEQAIAIAEGDAAELTLVHVMPHLEDPPTSRSPLEALGVYAIELKGLGQEKLFMQAHQDLASLLEEHESLVQQSAVRTQVFTHYDARRGLLDQADRTDAELLVIGKLGHSRIRDILLGSTAETISNMADCSVMAVH